ncbi:hypothetical protein RB614_01810 [Phytohabitans sp. ZYX-F-186]|uniref:FXSXX-COOH protein n=1 Tax=Phytohabitans maris TaxID=3071409 RepID=A0ABU0Z875_9ACTN|nr:hypothetical protein [Phytohabitans sp. ZYX-F-186]MDQ7903255.1 hypothetical protein [Phytohabitans sp. ZYX-F-186]
MNRVDSRPQGFGPPGLDPTRLAHLSQTPLTQIASEHPKLMAAVCRRLVDDSEPTRFQSGI